MTEDDDGVARALSIMKLLTTAEDYDSSWDERQQQKQKVIDASRLAVEADSADAFMTYLHGLALYRADNLPGAADILERLDHLEIENGMDLYDYLLAKCYMHNSCGRPDEAYVRCKKIIQRLNEHEAWLLDSGEDPDGWGRFPGMGEDGGFALAPDNLVAKPDKVCREIGKFLASRGDDADAERCLRVATDLESSWLNYWMFGSFLFECDRWAEAEAVFGRAYEVRNEAASANMIALCLAEQGRYKEAESAYRLALALDDFELDSDSAIVHNNLGILYRKQRYFDQAVAEFRLAIAENYRDEPERYVYELALTQYWAGKDADAEATIAQCFPLGYSLNSEYAAQIFNLLGLIRLKHSDRWLDALAMFGESIRRVANVSEVWANLARAERRLGLLSDACESLEQALRLDPESEVFKQRLATILNPNQSTHYETFFEFLKDGKVWLDSAKWTDPDTSSLLRSIFDRNLRWPEYVKEFPFINYEISVDFLDESLARAESLKELIRYEIESPVLLETPEMFIVMERNGDMLRSFVGAGAIGVAVSVNLTNWDLHYESDDSDAMFAAGASLNFFIDCSMDLSLHPKYDRIEDATTKLATTQTDFVAKWTTNAAFMSDVEGIRTGRLSNPPKAHRVRGFIRKLSERHPTDEARDRAPAFIRRNMGPDDTFVRPHQRGGGEAAERLYDRLRTHSSFADFLATAPRF